MWNLHVVAKTYGVRPSTILNIENEWVAYCVDNAVSLLGIDFENKLNDLDDKGHARHTIKELLSDNVRTAKDYIEKKRRLAPGSFKVVKGKSSV